MIVGLGSLSPIKVEAVKNALPMLGLQYQWQLVATNAESGVSDQPFGTETLLGATNRALKVAHLLPVALSVAIENGLFYNEGRWEDIGLVVGYIPKRGFLHMVESQPCFVPDEAVEEVRRKGGTIGKVLQSQGRVKSHNDPHQDLIGISRSKILEDAVADLFLFLRDLLVGGDR